MSVENCPWAVGPESGDDRAAGAVATSSRPDAAPGDRETSSRTPGASGGPFFTGILHAAGVALGVSVFEPRGVFVARWKAGE